MHGRERAFAVGSNGCRPEFRERNMNDRNGYGARPYSQILSDRNQPTAPILHNLSLQFSKLDTTRM